MTRSKRPWKKYADIKRIELNSGDFKYVTSTFGTYLTDTGSRKRSIWRGQFESLQEAEADLDAWWADWWPKQVKRTRSA